MCGTRMILMLSLCVLLLLCQPVSMVQLLNDLQVEHSQVRWNEEAQDFE